jgi:hypothetical protein
MALPMKKITRSGKVYETRFATANGQSNPRLAPPRGDVLGDEACQQPLRPFTEVQALEERHLAWLRSQRQDREL